MPSKTTIIKPQSYSSSQRLLQGAWIAFALLALVVYIMSVPYSLEGRIQDAERLFLDALPRLGMTPQGYAIYFTVLESLYVIVSFGMGVFLFSQRRHDKVALWIALALITFSATIGPSTRTLAFYRPDWVLWVAMMDAIGKITILFLFWIFPNGQFVPKWSFWLGLVIIPVSVVGSTIEASSFEADVWVYNVWVAVFALAGMFAQFWRYRKVSTPREQQQTKMVVYGFLLNVLPIFLFVLSDILFTRLLQQDPFLRLVYRLVVNLLFIYFPFVSLPISIGFAVLRYGLWGIDLIINRTLVTAIVGVGMLLTVVLASWIGSQVIPLPFAIILSIALVVVILNPLRQWARYVVDRRIYGFRFDLNDLKQAEKAKPSVGVVGQFTGQLLGGYELLGVIGRGGMGEVYKGYHQGEVVAIKVFHENILQTQEDKTRILREATIGKLFDNPRIVRVLGSGEENGQSYLILRYVEGQEMRDYLREHHKFSVEDACYLLIDLAETLAIIHEKGIVHRDMKPANVLLCTSQDAEVLTPVLMDFGVARFSGEIAGIPPEAWSALNASVTGTHAVGTIDYMSPEQIMESRAVDHRADLYGLGVIAFEMLSGERPFKGNSSQILFGHLNQPAPDIRTRAPHVPEKIAQIISKALEKDPNKRFDTLKTFAQAIKVSL